MVSGTSPWAHDGKMDKDSGRALVVQWQAEAHQLNL